MGKLLGSTEPSQDHEHFSQPSTDNSKTSPPQNLRNAPKFKNVPENKDALSSSIVNAVNIAAETARLVLDQATEEIVKSNITSKCSSYASLLGEEEGDERSKYKLAWFEESSSEGGGGTKTVTFSSPLPEKTLAASSVSNITNVSMRSDLTANTDESNVPGSSPPPLAFQNLPMSRYFPLSNTEHNVDRGGVAREVKNHYDAAAAISAALASSHLAQASRCVGELQLANEEEKKKGIHRDESFTDESVDVVLTPSQPTQRRNSDSMGKRGESRDKIDNVPQTRTLPSPQEAGNEMRARRESYESLNDESFTDYVAQVQLSEKKSENMNGNCVPQEKKEKETVVDRTRRKSTQTEGCDSISICSSNSCGFDNESNTSSYGSSDFSPITMSFGSSADDGTRKQNVAGILGSLSKSHIGAASQGDASLDPSANDDEVNAHEGGTNREVRASGERQVSDPGPKLSMHLAPSRTGSGHNIRIDSTLRKTPENTDKHSTQTPASTISINPQYVTLFESFDRNWIQLVEQYSNREKVLELAQKFLSSFVVVLGMCGTNARRNSNGCDKNNISSQRHHCIFSETDPGLTRYDWWDDSNILGYNFGIMAEGQSDNPGNVSVGVPQIVVRTMWKACFFDSADVVDDETEATVDSIQDYLMNSLCYLSETKSSSVPCFCLTLSLYKDYAWYILSRVLDKSSIEEIVEDWHSKFARVLRETLLRHEQDDDTLSLRRYAAYTLPRHTVFGLQGIGQINECSLDITPERLRKTHIDVMKKLLCDSLVVTVRSELLGSGRMRDEHVHEPLNSEVDRSLVRAVKEDRVNDHNLLPATIAHLKDIELFSSFFDSMSESSDRDDTDNEARGNYCIEALSLWRDKLLLLSSENNITSIKGNNPSDELVSSTQNINTAHVLHKYGARAENCLDIAKNLLSKDDAWSSSDDKTLERGVQIKKQYRSRRIHNKIIEAESLEMVVNIRICHLRTQTTIGRSFLTLAKFAQTMLNKNSSCATASAFQELISICLRDAIEVLSCISKKIQIILSDLLQDLEEDDLDDSVKSTGPTFCLQKFALTRAEAKPLLTLTGIFLAEAWFLLGRMSASPSSSKSLKDKQAVVACFERSLLILSPSKGSCSSQLTEQLSLPLTRHKLFLQSNIYHAMGVCLYEAGVFERSERSLTDAIILRRQLLDKLRSQSPELSDQYCDLTTFCNNFGSYFFAPPQSVSKEMLSNVLSYSCSQCCALLPPKIIEKSESEDLELSLSLTLEYAALTYHASHSYHASLASFQEALILRSLHVGKNSLDIASLHFNTGVVHDDLEQYPQAINRYHESLRIRLNHLKNASASDSSDIEDSVLLTLKCMAHVYKITDDLDNAICFYIKALVLLKTKVSRHMEPADKWQIMGMRLDLSIPSPTIVFDETRKDNYSGDAWKLHFQTINKKSLCHYFSEPEHRKSDKISMTKKWEKELVKMHSMVVALIQKKKHAVDTPNKFSMRSSPKVPISQVSSVTLESISKSQILFDTALVSSSFCLGRSRISAHRHDEAIDNFEVALRAKWALDPASSSDSDSDMSSSRLSMRSKLHSKNISEDEPEEGQLYYALGLANAMLDDNERAVRCYITALRYLRRSLRMVDSLEVARVLFDTAASYYYLCDFDQAEVHWLDCLRILGAHENQDVHSWRRGIVLYCLVLNQSAHQTTYNSSMYNMLNEAQALLSAANDKTILAYLAFLTGNFLYQTVSKIPIRLRPQIPTKMKVVPIASSIGDLSWNELCNFALSLFDQVKNECWFDLTLEEAANMNDLKHLPISAHVFLLEGQVLELLGRSGSAMDSYKHALNLYRIACGHDNAYSASVLHRMGTLCSHTIENGHKALGFFNESIAMRKAILGGNDPRLAESLYCSATVLTLLYRYESAMERFHEALRIQMATTGQSSNAVATTLTGMGLCHYNHKSYDLALTCLMGALKVRHHRVSRLQKALEDTRKAVTDTGATSSEVIDNSCPSYENLDEAYVEETALGDIYFNLGNVHFQLRDHSQAMNYFIKARDLKWRHVGGGSTEKIMKRYTWSDIDEDELLGLAHCLHNIGLLFDIKKEHDRSLPHYEEALKIKNALAGFDSKGYESILANESDKLVLKCLDDDTELPIVTKATLPTAMTHLRMASLYAKKKMYGHSLFHYCHALKIQRSVLGRDHFTTSALLNNMAHILRRTNPQHRSETAEVLYKESLRISSLSLGKNHERVAYTLFNLGELYGSKHQFDQAIGYYRSALSIYRDKYSTRLMQRLCCTFLSTMPKSTVDIGEDSSEVLSTGDQIVMHNTSFPTKEIQKQYSLVSEALRNATREEAIRAGRGTWLSVSSHEYWLRLEVLLFQFVEMISTYVVDPANTAVKNVIVQSQQRIESAATHAIITASDALDYQFQLMLQE